MSTYLLDTSAIRRVPTAQLASLSERFTQYASPFAFWEIASHLADVDDFDRIKRILMKFQHISLLSEPTADAERSFTFADVPIEDSLESPGVIYAALAALRASQTLEEFYRCHIQDKTGSVRQIEGCVARINTMLEEGESSFKTFMSNVKEAIQTRQVSLAEQIDRHEAVRDLVNGWWLQIKHRTDGSDETYRAVLRRGYLFYAYVLYRASDYVVRQTRKIDGNDFEDAKLLLHLTLDDHITIVTSDKGLRRAVTTAVNDLNSLNDDWFKTRVIAVDTAVVFPETPPYPRVGT